MPRVREVMTPDPATASPSMSVVEAAKEMIQKEKGPLPVVEGGRVVAMVTDRDIIARVVAAGQDPSALRVSDIATKDLVTIGPNQDVKEARQLMAQHQLDRLLVVEEGDRLEPLGRRLIGDLDHLDVGPPAEGFADPPGEGDGGVAVGAMRPGP